VVWEGAGAQSPALDPIEHQLAGDTTLPRYTETADPDITKAELEGWASAGLNREP
jgi:hypothetical protein